MKFENFLQVYSVCMFHMPLKTMQRTVNNMSPEDILQCYCGAMIVKLLGILIILFKWTPKALKTGGKMDRSHVVVRDGIN